MKTDEELMGSQYSTGLVAIKSLQENAHGFFNRIQSTYETHMNCRKGCDSCCHVSLNIFESEAVRILDWALELSTEEKQTLKAKLASSQNTQVPDSEKPLRLGKDAAGNVRKKCAALVDGACSIYPARPVICRTQGAPLQWKKDDGKGNIEINQDVCPLNFKSKETLPPSGEWLDLDKLAALQSIAENQFQKHGQKPEWKRTAEGRISLEEVVSHLIRVIE